MAAWRMISFVSVDSQSPQTDPPLRPIGDVDLNGSTAERFHDRDEPFESQMVWESKGAESLGRTLRWR